MKLVIAFIVLHLFAFVPADIEGELRRSIETVMKCQYRDPPKGPVIAVSPARFAQIVVILHERFQTAACGKPLNSPIDVTDERTWPFCVFGRCVQDKCHCAGHFSGPKCNIYTKKCWLMYCYLTSCHPSHQSLHCICDPYLYGTRITSGIYWYNEGKSTKYIPPPTGWKDDPERTHLIQWKGDSVIDKVSSEQKQLFPNVMPAKNDAQLLNALSSSEVIKSLELPSSQTEPNMRKFYPKAVASIPRFDSAGRVLGPKAKYRENTAGNRISELKTENTAGNRISELKTEKTDVEEALEQLEEVSVAMNLNICNIYVIVLISLSVNFLLKAAVG